MKFVIAVRSENDPDGKRYNIKYDTITEAQHAAQKHIDNWITQKDDYAIEIKFIKVSP